MKLRFSARGDHPDAVVHLTVLDALHLAGRVRHRGEALCRPKASLPNLEPLIRQVLEGRRCCPACVDRMARIRVHHPVELPPAAGLVASDLIRDRAQAREASRARPRRQAISSSD